MKTVHIKRFCSSPMGVFGELNYVSEDMFSFHCFTVERPWLDNKPYESCIPRGQYPCKPVNSPKFGDTYEVTNVDERTHILIHAGNVATDFQGCIGLGSALGCVNGKWAVINSRETTHRFKEQIGDNEFLLIITRMMEG